MMECHFETIADYEETRLDVVVGRCRQPGKNTKTSSANVMR